MKHRSDFLFTITVHAFCKPQFPTSFLIYVAKDDGIKENYYELDKNLKHLRKMTRFLMHKIVERFVDTPLLLLKTEWQSTTMTFLRNIIPNNNSIAIIYVLKGSVIYI